MKLTFFQTAFSEREKTVERVDENAGKDNARQGVQGGGREEEGVSRKTAFNKVNKQAHQAGSQKVAQETQQPDRQDASFPEPGFVLQTQALGRGR